MAYDLTKLAEVPVIENTDSSTSFIVSQANDASGEREVVRVSRDAIIFDEVSINDITNLETINGHSVDYVRYDSQSLTKAQRALARGNIGLGRIDEVLSNNILNSYKFDVPLDMNNHSISNLPTPSNNSDAATKGYIDSNLVSSSIEHNETFGTYACETVEESLNAINTILATKADTPIEASDVEYEASDVKQVLDYLNGILRGTHQMSNELQMGGNIIALDSGANVYAEDELIYLQANTGGPIIIYDGGIKGIDMSAAPDGDDSVAVNKGYVDEAIENLSENVITVDNLVTINGHSLYNNSGVDTDIQIGYTLPTASSYRLGGVKVDGSSITITKDGTIKSNSGVKPNAVFVADLYNRIDFEIERDTSTLNVGYLEFNGESGYYSLIEYLSNELFGGNILPNEKIKFMIYFDDDASQEEAFYCVITCPTVQQKLTIPINSSVEFPSDNYFRKFFNATGLDEYHSGQYFYIKPEAYTYVSDDKYSGTLKYASSESVDNIISAMGSGRCCYYKFSYTEPSGIKKEVFAPIECRTTSMINVNGNSSGSLNIENKLTSYIKPSFNDYIYIESASNDAYLNYLVKVTLSRNSIGIDLSYYDRANKSISFNVEPGTKITSGELTYSQSGIENKTIVVTPTPQPHTVETIQNGSVPVIKKSGRIFAYNQSINKFEYALDEDTPQALFFARLYEINGNSAELVTSVPDSWSSNGYIIASHDEDDTYIYGVDGMIKVSGTSSTIAVPQSENSKFYISTMTGGVRIVFGEDADLYLGNVSKRKIDCTINAFDTSSIESSTEITGTIKVDGTYVIGSSDTTGDIGMIIPQLNSDGDIIGYKCTISEMSPYLLKSSGSLFSASYCYGTVGISN